MRAAITRIGTVEKRYGVQTFVGWDFWADENVDEPWDVAELAEIAALAAALQDPDPSDFA